MIRWRRYADRRMHSPLCGETSKVEIRAHMKLFIVLLVSLTPVQAGSADKDALLSNYKNKFAVILQDGISTCLHRSTGEEFARALEGIPAPDLPEGASKSMTVIDQIGRAVYWPGNSLQQALQNCQLDPLHKGEIVKVIHAD